MTPTFFATQAAFRKWLEKHYRKETELLVGFYKTGSGKPSMTWPESVDQALCFGWIDGVRRSIDEESYSIRFSQRKPASIWSAINIKKVETLTEQGLMKPEGLQVFSLRRADCSAIYSHEKEEAIFDPAFERLFRKNKKAWTYFQSLAPSYRKTSIHWVMSAKQPATRSKRLDQLIADSEAGRNQWKDNKYMKK